MNRSLAAAASATARRSSRLRSPASRRAWASRPRSIDLGELALLRSVQQRHLADLVEVQTNRITHVRDVKPPVTGGHSLVTSRCFVRTAFWPMTHCNATSRSRAFPTPL